MYDLQVRTKMSFRDSFALAVHQLVCSCKCEECGSIKIEAIKRYAQNKEIACYHESVSDVAEISITNSIILWSVVNLYSPPGGYTQYTQCILPIYGKFVDRLSEVISIDLIPTCLKVAFILRLQHQHNNYVFIGEYVEGINHLNQMCINIQHRLPKYAKRCFIKGEPDALISLRRITKYAARKNNKHINPLWQQWEMKSNDFTHSIQWLPKEMIEDIGMFISKPNPESSRVILA